MASLVVSVESCVAEVRRLARASSELGRHTARGFGITLRVHLRDAQIRVSEHRLRCL
jgi:hypothetical protein